MTAGGQLLQQALTIITGIVIARMLGPAAYGIVNILRNISNAIAILAPMGLDLALLKHIGRADPNSRRADIVLGRLRLMALGVNTAVVLIGAVLAGPLMRHVYRYEHFDVLLIVTLVGIPIGADVAIMGAVYRARGRAGLFSLMTLYLQPISRVVMVAAAWFLARNALAIVAINTTQVALSAIALFFHFRGRNAQVALDAPGPFTETISSKEAWVEARGVLKESGWMAVNLFVYGTIRFVDILTLGAFAPAKIVGEYAALSTVAQLVQVWPMAASQSLGPTISQRFHAGDMDGVRSALSDYLHMASIVGGFIFAGVATFGDRLDLIFGKSFQFHSGVAFLMPLGYLLSATLAPMGYALSMTGRHRAELVILGFGGVILFVCCQLLVPPLGQIGAAIAVAISFALINIARFVYVSRTLGFVPGRPIDFLFPVLALATAFSGKLSIEHLMGRSFLSTFLACVLFAVVYSVIILFVFTDGAGREKLRQRLPFLGRAQ